MRTTTSRARYERVRGRLDHCAARREGVTLFAKADGKLGWKGAQRPSDVLLAVLKEHREEILALLPLPASASFAIGPAKATVTRLQALGFRAYLDHGTLLIADATGRRRDVSRYLPIKEVFDRLNAGLDEDPGLLEPYTDPEQRDDPDCLRRALRPPQPRLSSACPRQNSAAAKLTLPFSGTPIQTARSMIFAGSGMARLGLGLAGRACSPTTTIPRRCAATSPTLAGAIRLATSRVRGRRPADAAFL